MKIFNTRLISGLLLSVTLTSSLTGCMDDIEVTQVATEDQVGSSTTALESMVSAMSASFNQVDMSYVNNNKWHGCFGYGAMMYSRDLMTDDFSLNDPSGYATHFNSYSRNQNMDETYIFASYLWGYYYNFILTANNVISGVNPETATPTQLGYLGAGYAFRAFSYIDLARLFEFLPNDVFPDGKNDDGNVVTNLTVPIVKEGMNEADARNNPRVKREEMYNFILDDLNKAEEYIVNLSSTSGKTLPDLSCVYGLKARLYMWVEDYPNAEKYARLAIDNASVNPMSQDDCLNTTTGFNDITKWMWGATQNSETSTVQTGIINWISWASNQTSFGYTGWGTGMYSEIDLNMYNRISDTDFRKLEWVAPQGSPLYGQNSYVSAKAKEKMPAYAALKFRPNEGNSDASSVGASASVPIMRVEEMYFIEAEAAAHRSAADGKQLVENFMREYRDPEYTCRVSTPEDVVEEIVFQKRVELWGEGQTFFDIKRLDYSVTRGYEGTLFEPLARFNTNGRPAWMNIVVPRSEVSNNGAIEGYNNPNPSDKYTPWTGQ